MVKQPLVPIENAGLDPAAMDQLNSAEARALLDTIDAIRELQVGDMVDLPQIIVVGDQSAGKSSVLEAISRVRFPVKSGLCTRFATELVLRKAAHSKVSVGIKWADESSSGSKPQPNQDWTGFDKDSLPKLISQAEETMGFVGSVPKGFSEDILRVEITGPDVYPLTLVDLPGFYYSGAEGQTFGGKAIIDQLAESYMKQKNSIILAVVSANNELANQTVLERAKLHDPARERTIGVVTKPDLAGPGTSNEQNCLRLVNGHDKIHKLALGWHVLRNPPQQDQKTSAEDRDAKEGAFFRGGTWGSISPSRRGAKELRKKLSKVLLEHIRRSLPKVVSEIEESLREREKRLERVGKSSRETTDEMRSYLLDIADRFQRLARDGVEGRYADPFFGGLYDGGRKIRAQLRNLNRAFGETLLDKGAKYNILSDADIPPAADDNGENDALPEILQPFLGLFSRFPNPETVTEEELCRRLDLLASINGGKEFPGAPNSDLVVQLFKEQAKPWHDIAALHLELVSDYTKSFVEQLIGHVIAGSASLGQALADGGPATNRTVAAVLCGHVDPFFEAKAEVLRGKLDELLRPYTTGFNIPLELELRRTMSKRTAVRLAGRVAGLLTDRTGDDDETPGDRRKEILALIQGTESLHGNSGSPAENVIDMMLTYYEMSLRTFTDTVINLAVENCLVYEIPNILTPGKVDCMDEKTLRDLAQESDEIREERGRLRRETELLRQALQKCRVYRPREISVLPTQFPRMSAAVMPPSSQQVSKAPNGKRADEVVVRLPRAESSSGATPSPPSSLGSRSTDSIAVADATTPKPSYTPSGVSAFGGAHVAAATAPPAPGASAPPRPPKPADSPSGNSPPVPSAGDLGGGFGSAAPKSTGLFGSSPLGGNSPAGTATASSLFGGKSTTATATPTSSGSSLFGGGTTTTTTTAPSSGGLFGGITAATTATPTTSGGGLFANIPATTAAPSSGGGFSGFGGGGFGAAPAASPPSSLFGTTAAANPPSALFGTTAAANPPNALFGTTASANPTSASGSPAAPGTGSLFRSSATRGSPSNAQVLTAQDKLTTHYTGLTLVPPSTIDLKVASSSQAEKHREYGSAVDLFYHISHISALHKYSRFSAEEVRLTDYMLAGRC
ncbi:hypothetical protein RB595_004429 [Gaeumannomyces hyphopodioides]